METFLTGSDPFRCRRCHKVGHLLKDYPLNGKARAEDTGKTIPSKVTMDAEHHTSTKVAAITEVKETPKKHGKAPYQPPSPSLTRARAVAAVVLSSGIPISNPVSLNFSTSSCIIASSIVDHQGSTYTYSLPKSLACSLQPPPTFSCIPPYFLEPIPYARSSDSDQGSLSHNYLLRSLSRSQPLNSIGIGLITPSIPLKPL